MQHNISNQRINYFQSIHKAIRRLLFLMSIELGCVDFTCNEALEKLYTQLNTLKSLLKSHAEQENSYFLSFIQQHLPQEAQEMAASHPEFEIRFEEITDLFETILKMNNPQSKLNTGYSFYVQFNHFIANYLGHLHHEEAVIMPLLWEQLDDKVLFEPLQAFLSNMSKEALQTSLSYMMPAINPQEKDQMQNASFNL